MWFACQQLFNLLAFISIEKILFQSEEETIAVQEHLYQNRRLIVSHSTKRSRKDARDRDEI